MLILYLFHVRPYEPYERRTCHVRVNLSMYANFRSYVVSTLHVRVMCVTRTFRTCNARYSLCKRKTAVLNRLSSASAVYETYGTYVIRTVVVRCTQQTYGPRKPHAPVKSQVARTLHARGTYTSPCTQELVCVSLRQSPTNDRKNRRKSYGLRAPYVSCDPYITSK